MSWTEEVGLDGTNEVQLSLLSFAFFFEWDFSSDVVA
jgi:hypothetical protein